METFLPNADPSIGEVMERRAGLDLCTASRELLLVSLSTIAARRGELERGLTLARRPHHPVGLSHYHKA
jgi:hypothetical protein